MLDLHSTLFTVLAALIVVAAAGCGAQNTDIPPDTVATSPNKEAQDERTPTLGVTPTRRGNRPGEQAGEFADMGTLGDSGLLLKGIPPGRTGL